MLLSADLSYVLVQLIQMIVHDHDALALLGILPVERVLVATFVFRGDFTSFANYYVAVEGHALHFLMRTARGTRAVHFFLIQFGLHILILIFGNDKY